MQSAWLVRRQPREPDETGARSGSERDAAWRASRHCAGFRAWRLERTKAAAHRLRRILVAPLHVSSCLHPPRTAKAVSERADAQAVRAPARRRPTHEIAALNVRSGQFRAWPAW
jgi:hypothetical protein